MEKINTTNYSIADMAKQLGMTTEGIRYYEKQGIVSFQRAPDTGRSVFRSRCAIVLRFIRSYNTLGIPLSKTHLLLAARDDQLAQAANEFNKLCTIQRKKIWRETRILDRINDHASFMRTVGEGKMARSFGSMPDLRILCYGDGIKLRSNKKLSDMTAAWQKYNPISFPVVICPSDRLDMTYNDCLFGLAFEERDYAVVLDELPPDPSEAVRAVSGTSCLFLHMVEQGDDTVSMAELLKDELAYLARRNMKICGDIVLRPVVVNSQSDGYRIHHMAWLPVTDCDESAE
ncbi:MAG: MerR family transcriptional regulator [Christensenellales bacterium]|jgi:DNA-binding transcriptional MerR regulator